MNTKTETMLAVQNPLLFDLEVFSCEKRKGNYSCALWKNHVKIFDQDFFYLVEDFGNYRCPDGTECNALCVMFPEGAQCL